MYTGSGMDSPLTTRNNGVDSSCWTLSGVRSRVAKESLGDLTTLPWSTLDFRRGATKGAEAADAADAAAKAVGRRDRVNFLCVGLLSEILSGGAATGAEDPVFSENAVVLTGVCGAFKAEEDDCRDSDVVDGLSDSSLTDSNSLSATIRVSPYDPEAVPLVSCAPVAYCLVNSLALYLNNSLFSLNSVALK